MRAKKFRHKPLLIMVVLLTTVIMLRVLAPDVVTHYVNQTIAKTPGITGQVRDVDLAIIAGTYSLIDINIRQLGDSIERPLLVAPRMDISVLWEALLKGKIVSDIQLQQPFIGLYDRPDDKLIEAPAVTNEKTWLGLANNLAPFSIDRLDINDGRFIIEAKNQLKRAELALENVQLVVTNISSIKGPDTIAQAKLTTDIQNQAKVVLTASFDPNTPEPTFNLDFAMEKLPTSYIDALVKFYAPFDFEAGQIDIASELKSTGGNITGYAKFGIYNLEVFSWHEDIVEDNEDPFTALSEMLGGLLATLFENDRKDLVATRIPIEGTLNDPDISSLDAFFGIVRNAFVKAYKFDIEHKVSGLKIDAPISANPTDKSAPE